MFDVAALERETNRILREHEQALDIAMETAGQAAVKEASTKTGFVKRSPNGLATQNRHRIIRTAGGKILRLSNPAKHARAIDGGAKPHVIKGNPWLYFKGRSGGLIRVRSVNHPGNKPFRFLRNAAGNAYNSVGDRYTRHMLRALRR